MVTIGTCYSLPEAQVIQSQLEGSGIETFLPDELTVQNNWLWANAIGGVRVQVPDEDVTRAVEVLAAGPAEKVEAAVCPHCSRTLTSSYGFGLYARILFALLYSIPLHSKPTLRCPSCGTIRP
jgi:hypothetical protein